jgi:hypothetical protein
VDKPVVEPKVLAEFEPDAAAATLLLLGAFSELADEAAPLELDIAAVGWSGEVGRLPLDDSNRLRSRTSMQRRRR